MNDTRLTSRRGSSSLSAFLAAAGLCHGQTFQAFARDAAGRVPKFKLRYGPHPGTFKASAGDDGIDQVKFAADQGFTGWEDNGLPGRTPELQEKIGKTLSDLGMKMGVFVAYQSGPRSCRGHQRRGYEPEGGGGTQCHPATGLAESILRNNLTIITNMQ